jgi:hypothetical protein
MIDYQQALGEANKNEDVLGFILTGSRGKGFENEHSDYDAIMIVKDESANEIREKLKGVRDGLDLTIQSLSEFKKAAEWESADAWNRYDYAHMQLIIDRTNGEIKTLIEQKGKISPEKLKDFIGQALDGYINGVYRSVKCIRNHNGFGGQLEASNSMLDLLTLVFAFEGRHRPFLGYVEKELQKYPLEKLSWPPKEFVQKMEKVMTTADLETQQELLRGIENIGREMGYGHMLDAWEGKDKWSMEFKA